MFLNIRSLLLLTLIYGPNAGVEAVDAPPPENRLEEIVVSGAFEGRKLGTAILGTTILNKEAIQRQLDGSIGETLRRQPGISSTFFGPGASRPIIRGLGGDRIRILDSGLGSIDASSTSPDHATAIEPALAERIEILRGTAMLMYGSSAAGGVVNVLDGRIPNSAPENTFDGAVRYGHTTVNDGDEIVGAFNAQLGKVGGTTVIFHGDALYRATSDYKIPGFAESQQVRDAEAAEAEASGEALEEEAFGIAENSETKTTGAFAGLSFLFSNGFIGMNVKLLDSSYGVPGGHEHDDHDDDDDHDDHEGTEEAPVTIELDQLRYDLRGEIKGDYGFFKKVKIRFGYADYEHLELEGNEIGTVFSNEGWEGRLDFIHNGNDTWGGASGIQIKSRDFSAIGEEAFVPATISKQYGF
ncbi:MAG: TonB-dependent receptor plug domain-containing protein, partial [Kordiimonadaceae bacterium]|nr:TonB-dependent receptor plug domain-containing protein [Kordiimonadaceae bacterium]